MHDLRRQQLFGHGGNGGDELHGLPWVEHVCSRSDELLLYYGLLRKPSYAYDGHVRTGPSRQVPGDDERRDNVLYGEHIGQLSGGD